MNTWSANPFIRLLLSLITGILACYYSNGYVGIPIWSLPCLLALIIIYHALNSRLSTYNNRWIFGSMISIFIFMTGYSLTTNTLLENQRNHFTVLTDDPLAYMGRVIEEPIEKDKSYKLILSIDEVRCRGNTYKTRGKTLCYVAKDSVASTLDYGDSFVFTTRPMRTRQPSNPGEFNYAAYLSHQGIFTQVYLPASTYMVTSRVKGNPIKAYSLAIREIVLNIFKQHGVSGNQFNVAAAILLGYDDLLDDNQRQEYAGAGVIHVLCVSGLHVGIIFVLARYLLFFIRRNDRYNFTRPALIIIIIWLYAMITGLAPPVLRASLMFTLITIGQSVRRQSNTMNSLAVAAFILLIVNPRLIFNVGFQLSFSAVAGIVSFQPYIVKIYSPVNVVGQFLWNLTSVSLAAQLATAPLALFYFHQFPNYFLLANLIAIPLSGILIYSGVFLLMFSWIPVISNVAAFILVFELKILNTAVSFIENLPGAVSRSIYLSELSTILVYAVIISSFYFLVSHRKSLLIASLSFVLLLSLNISMLNVKRNNQQLIVFHQVNKHPVISLVNGRELLLITDSVIFNNSGLLNYPLDGFKVMAGLDRATIKCLSIQKEGVPNSPCFYYFMGKKIAIIGGNCNIEKYKSVINVDYVVLCNNISTPIERVAHCLKGAMFIIDSSNPTWRIASIEAQARQHGLKYHNIKESGALVIKL